jgi:superfamily II DNA or RNA helicase
MTKDEIQLNALNSLKTNIKQGIVMSMGTGKTRLGLSIINKFIKDDKKCLVVVPTNSIKDSWDKEIDLIEFKQKSSIVFINYRSLHKIKVSDYKLIICDESHSVTEKNYEVLKNCKFLIGLTGTPIVRELSDKFRIFSTLFPTVFNYSLSNAIEDKILNRFKLFVHLIPLSNEKDIEIKNFYVSEVGQYNWISKKISEAFSIKEKQMLGLTRLRYIKEFKSKEDYIKYKIIPKVKQTNSKVLIFTSTIDQSNRLYPYSYNSKNPDSEKNLKLFQENEIQILTSVNQLKEGINIPNLQSAVVMHSYSSDVQLAQRLGRILRLSPNLVSNLHVLVYKDTVDEEWFKKALPSINAEIIYKQY